MGCYTNGGVVLLSTEPHLGSVCQTFALFAAHREEGAEQSENLLNNEMKPTLSFRSLEQALLCTCHLCADRYQNSHLTMSEILHSAVSASVTGISAERGISQLVWDVHRRLVPVQSF